MDKWREALIEYMLSVAICDGGEYGLNTVTGCLEQLLNEVEQRLQRLNEDVNV
jgi:hypothetical protein